MKRSYLILLLLPCLILSCSDEKDYVPIASEPEQAVLNLPDVPYNYNEPLPTYFYTNDSGPVPSSVNGIDNTPSSNPITNEGATLGRVLFYDKNLSQNRTTACGSCHRAEKSFADSSPFSHGLFGAATKRNSMTLINTRFYQRGRFFYDERAATLEKQVVMPILDHTEMALTLDEIKRRVEEKPYYSRLFIAAFGSSVVTNERIEQALSQFIRSMVSHKSKYDMGRAQVVNMRDPFPNFTQDENRGKDLFLKSFADGGVNCYACHTTEAFVSHNSGPVNNGLDAVSATDQGAYGFYTSAPELAGAFKIPTLRNIALTGPYMHDARFNSLMQVIEHYNSGVQNHTNLSPLLKRPDGMPRQLNLSDADKLALLRFLNTLTDQTIMSDPKWIDPFINQHL
ncbi:cytochrome-c peroxidase [Flavobacterium album]|uniref:Cytochrome-c peroxidase n=1 Tax=Flavobacterium album TaxID=2175091 RepID=A0A2S1QZI8_9FLAO|nr:cytochrome c peroxidase [Flavobacterium album]AWH85729.1 cytochrome-c peroxidase [Flavobacterium album]